MMATNARESMRFIEKIVEEPKWSERVILESPEEAGPNWKTCLTFKTRSPKCDEFQTTKTNGTKSISRKERAVMPLKLMFLLRPCVKKTHIDSENWVLITEDQTTRIWAEAFGITCVNLNQADAELFNNKNGILTDKPTRKATTKRTEKVHVESFDAIEFAPRGAGKLWTP